MFLKLCLRHKFTLLDWPGDDRFLLDFLSKWASNELAWSKKHKHDLNIKIYWFATFGIVILRIGQRVIFWKSKDSCGHWLLKSAMPGRFFQRLSTWPGNLGRSMCTLQGNLRWGFLRCFCRFTRKKGYLVLREDRQSRGCNLQGKKVGFINFNIFMTLREKLATRLARYLLWKDSL